MEIHFIVEQEAQLSYIAAKEGKRADELAREVLLRDCPFSPTHIAVRA